jgi:hypothetical protein
MFSCSPESRARGKAGVKKKRKDEAGREDGRKLVEEFRRIGSTLRFFRVVLTLRVRIKSVSSHDL